MIIKWIIQMVKVKPIVLQITLDEPWSQSYDFWIYNYNAICLVGKSVFLSGRRHFCFKNALG
jgi:hypothetical protein